MALTVEEIRKKVREARKALKVTQIDLTLTSSTGMRFISKLEKDKET